jgi:hypothetical protein
MQLKCRHASAPEQETIESEGENDPPARHSVDDREILLREVVVLPHVETKTGSDRLNAAAALAPGDLALREPRRARAES